jgi:hypothetical protein
MLSRVDAGVRSVPVGDELTQFLIRPGISSLAC